MVSRRTMTQRRGSTSIDGTTETRQNEPRSQQRPPARICSSPTCICIFFAAFLICLRAARGRGLFLLLVFRLRLRARDLLTSHPDPAQGIPRHWHRLQDRLLVDACLLGHRKGELSAVVAAGTASLSGSWLWRDGFVRVSI